MGKIVAAVGFDIPEDAAQPSALDALHRPGVAASASCTIGAGAPAIPPFGTNRLHIAPHKTTAVYYAGPLATFTAASIAMASFYVRRDSAVNPTAVNPVNTLIGVLDETNTPFFFVKIDNSLDYEFYDSTSTLMVAFGSTAGLWKRLTVLFQPGDATGDWAIYGADAGDPNLFGGGTAAFGGTSAQRNFNPGGTDMGMVLGGQGGNQPPPGGDCDVYHAGCYLADDVTDINDAVGPSAGKNDFQCVYEPGYKITKAFQVPDCDKAGAAGGDNTTGGNWSTAGVEDLATTECFYTAPAGGNQLDGAVKVDAPASRQLDAVRAFMYHWYYKAPAATFYGIFGIYDGTTYNVNLTGVFPTTAGGYKYNAAVFDVKDEVGATKTGHDVQAVQGFEARSAQAERIGYFAEGWIGSIEAAPILTGKASIGKTARNVRGKRRWH